MGSNLGQNECFIVYRRTGGQADRRTGGQAEFMLLFLISARDLRTCSSLLHRDQEQDMGEDRIQELPRFSCYCLFQL